MRLAVYMLMALSPLMLSSQLTLDRCVELARENYPLVRQYELIRRTENATLSDIGKSWLPRIGAYAQATVQNDVPEFPSGIFPPALASAGFDMPGMRKDQYKVGIDLNQTIWDGGKSAADRTVARHDAMKCQTMWNYTLWKKESRFSFSGYSSPNPRSGKMRSQRHCSAATPTSCNPCSATALPCKAT